MKPDHYDPESFERDLNAIAHKDSLDQKIRTLEVIRTNLYLDLKRLDGRPGLDFGPANFRTAQLLVKVIAQEADLEKQRKKFFTFNAAPLSLHSLWTLLLDIPALAPLLSSPAVQAEVLARLQRHTGEIGADDED